MLCGFDVTGFSGSISSLLPLHLELSWWLDREVREVGMDSEGDLLTECSLLERFSRNVKKAGRKEGGSCVVYQYIIAILMRLYFHPRLN